MGISLAGICLVVLVLDVLRNIKLSSAICVGLRCRLIHAAFLIFSEEASKAM
ncbi:TPA: hypothetical protein U5D86_002647 [Yersinia enterocolitica]|nr:hypothetical protein [Yersinia enterocolitica]